LSIILEFFSFNSYVLDFGLEGGVLGLGLGSCGLGLGGYVLVNITDDQYAIYLAILYHDAIDMFSVYSHLQQV